MAINMVIPSMGDYLYHHDHRYGYHLTTPITYALMIIMVANCYTIRRYIYMLLYVRYNKGCQL